MYIQIIKFDSWVPYDSIPLLVLPISKKKCGKLKKMNNLTIMISKHMTKLSGWLRSLPNFTVSIELAPNNIDLDVD